jgi:prophage antirepressor-like protein
MNELQTFSNSEFGNIRTIMIDDEPWFVGKDVAMALGYGNTQKALKDHVDDEDKRGARIVTPGGKQTMTVINESGLYSLILSSKLPNAKKFKRWVTSEVLPAIRKNGSYTIETAQVVERETTMDDYLKAASIVASCRNERLPYVFTLLNRAGIELNSVQPDSSKDTTGECARLINTAVNEYGLSVHSIAKLVGLQTTQIQRIRTGSSIPTIHRSQVICDAIRQEIPEIE